MALSTESESWKKRCRLLCGLFIVLIGYVLFYYCMGYLKQSTIYAINQQITQQEEQIKEAHNMTGFNEFLAIKKLESETIHLPWSDYVNAILSILKDVKVAGAGGDVKLSDFKVNLQEVTLNGSAQSLQALYLTGETGRPALIQRFNELNFLSDISIRKYERLTDNYDYNYSSDNEGEGLIGYTFSLSAKVNNDARTESEPNG